MLFPCLRALWHAPFAMPDLELQALAWVAVALFLPFAIIVDFALFVPQLMFVPLAPHLAWIVGSVLAVAVGVEVARAIVRITLPGPPRSLRQRTLSNR